MLLSASNDQSLRLWSLDGLEMGQLLGHDGFVFDFEPHGGETIISGGEDRMVRFGVTWGRNNHKWRRGSDGEVWG